MLSVALCKCSYRSLWSLLKKINVSYFKPSILISKAELEYISSAMQTPTVQGVVGIRRGCVVDASSVVGEESGLVVVAAVAATDAAAVPTLKVSVGVVLPVITVVSMDVGCDTVMFLGVVSWVDAVGEVGVAVVGGGCGVGEVRGAGVDVGGDDTDAVRTARVEEGDGKAMADGGEEVSETGGASEDAEEGVAVAAAVVTTVDAEDVDVF